MKKLLLVSVVLLGGMSEVGAANNKIYPEGAQKKEAFWKKIPNPVTAIKAWWNARQKANKGRSDQPRAGVSATVPEVVPTPAVASGRQQSMPRAASSAGKQAAQLAVALQERVNTVDAIRKGDLTNPRVQKMEQDRIARQRATEAARAAREEKRSQVALAEEQRRNARRAKRGLSVQTTLNGSSLTAAELDELDKMAAKQDRQAREMEKATQAAIAHQQRISAALAGPKDTPAQKAELERMAKELGISLPSTPRSLTPEEELDQLGTPRSPTQSEKDFADLEREVAAEKETNSSSGRQSSFSLHSISGGKSSRSSSPQQ